MSLYYGLGERDKNELLLHTTALHINSLSNFQLAFLIEKTVRCTLFRFSCP